MRLITRPEVQHSGRIPNELVPRPILPLLLSLEIKQKKNYPFQVLRKLSLVTLTGYMERYCPTHRSGWNWELPKFIKKIKTPDYKGTLASLNSTFLFTSCPFSMCLQNFNR